MGPTGIVLYGLGDLGLSIARRLLARRDLTLLGAVDIDPAKVGKTVAELTGLQGGEARVVADPDEILNQGNVDVVIHATSSRLSAVAPQIEAVLSAGVDVVSTCEELVYPFHRQADLAERIDSIARREDATVLGTGVNPGFLMDTLPIVLTAPCLEVEVVRVTRMMNSKDRRRSYQAKIGTGLTLEEFMEKVKRGDLTGHTGLFESATMIADALGFKVDRVEEPPLKAIIADRSAQTRFFKVDAGHVAGMSCEISIWEGRALRVALTFTSHCLVPDPYDEIVIQGLPAIKQRIQGGVSGDDGTIGMVLNAAKLITDTRSGLVTMLDLSIPRFRRAGLIR